MKKIKKNRRFLQNHGWAIWDIIDRDEKSGLPKPALQQPYSADAPRLALVPPGEFTVGKMPLIEAIGRRRSRRDFSHEPLSLEELSYLLWATQGLRDSSGSYRNVPSAGARHPFETYLIIKRVAGLQPGLYRYLAVEHQLCYLADMIELDQRAMDDYLVHSDDALVFIWAVVPYRTEWRYTILSHKMIAMEAGHICQNLYLAGTAINVGACAIGAFTQENIDTIIDVDGREEFAIYIARAGKL